VTDRQTAIFRQQGPRYTERGAGKKHSLSQRLDTTDTR